MDILEPLESKHFISTGDSLEDSKVIVNEIQKYSDKLTMESDDEQNVDHLSPQTLLETPGDDMHYSLRSPDGIVTYGVLKVEDSVDTVPQIVSSPNNFSNSGVQVLTTSNINGQLYVIHNTNDVFSSQTGARTIAPRSSLVDQNSTILPNNRKRDERRRATHNEVERRRRDKINNWIAKLAKIMPEGSPTDMKGNGHYDGQSKGGILAKACNYIHELRENEKNTELYMKENTKLTQSVELLKQKNAVLEQENKALKDMLKRSGIELPEH